MGLLRRRVRPSLWHPLLSPPPSPPFLSKGMVDHVHSQSTSRAAAPNRHHRLCCAKQPPLRRFPVHATPGPRGRRQYRQGRDVQHRRHCLPGHGGHGNHGHAQRVCAAHACRRRGDGQRGLCGGSHWRRVERHLRRLLR